MRKRITFALSLILLCSMAVIVFADRIVAKAAGTTDVLLTGTGSGTNVEESYTLVAPSGFSVQPNTIDTQIGKCGITGVTGAQSGDSISIKMTYTGTFVNVADNSDTIPFSVVQGDSKSSYTSGESAYSYVHNGTYFQDFESSNRLYIRVPNSSWEASRSGATYKTTLVWTSTYNHK